MSRPDAIKTEALNRVAKDASERALARDESVIGFAERHGWTKTHENQNDYFHDLTFEKGTKFVRLSLWPGLRKDIALAHTHTGAVAVKVPEPVRTRVERFLIGMECECHVEPDWVDSTNAAYEGRPIAVCPVHGDLS
jgi:hypothetical protein